MSAIVGARDKALRATIPRNINPTAGNSLLLDVDPPAFHQNSTGIPTIPSAKFTATPLGFAGTVMWSITSGGKLTGSTPNERTLLFSDMTVDTVKVTATIVFQGEAYIRVKSFYKTTDGKNGADADPTDPIDLSPEALVAALEGRITESQLYADLRARIDLVDGPSSNPQTVQGQIKKETDLRVGAINQEISDRIAALVAEAGARTTYVQSFTYSKQDITSAIAIKADAITAAYTAYADSTKSQAISAAAADVRSYSQSKVDAAQAETALTNTLTANYRSYADAARDQAVTTANAFVQTYYYGKTTVDNALSALADTLRSEFAATNGVTVGYLNNYYFTSAQTNSAIASATQTLSTTVGQHTATLQTQSQSLDGLSAQLTWKIDNNGHVSGFGLASTPVNGVPYSIVIFNVDALAVALPGGTGKTIFTVGQVDGQSQAVFRTDLFVDGGIKASKLAIGNADQVMPDSNMLDGAFWNRPDSMFIPQANNVWNSKRTLAIGVIGYEDKSTPFFPVEKGGIYKFDVQVFTSADYQGQLTIVAHLPNQEWCYMGCPQQGYNNGASGLLTSFDGSNRGGVTLFSATRTINTDDSAGNVQIRIISNVVAGYVQIGGIRVTRVVDSTLIGPGVVETKHLIIARGGAIYSGQTGFDQGEGFWLEGALAGSHGARFSLGDALGRKIRCDPANGIMELVNMDDLKPKFSASITNTQGQAYFTGPKANTFMGLFDVATLNGSAPFTYTWTIAGSSDIAQCRISGAINGTRVQLYGSSQVTGEFDFYLSVQATDGSGRVATQTYLVTGNFT